MTCSIAWHCPRAKDKLLQAAHKRHELRVAEMREEMAAEYEETMTKLKRATSKSYKRGGL